MREKSPFNPIRGLQAPPPPEKETTGKFFERVVGSKFGQIPAGKFSSLISGVEGITFVPVLGSKKDRRVHAVINYKNTSGERRRETWSIYENGISGKVPPELRDKGVSHEELTREIIRIVECVDISFWHHADLNIFPARDEGAPRQESGQFRDNPPEYPDPTRVKFINSQPESLFGIVGKRGFNGYHVVVFPGFLMLENPKVKNAAFFINLPVPIAIDKRRMNLPPAQRVSEEDRAKIMQSIASIFESAQTKQQLRQAGAVKIIHTQGSWEERMRREIAKRLVQQK